MKASTVIYSTIAASTLGTFLCARPTPTASTEPAPEMGDPVDSASGELSKMTFRECSRVADDVLY